jgi:hypothetical protein
MPNLALVEMKDLSSFRKIALGTWRTAYDPSIYGTLVLRMDRALDYIERFRARTGRRLTVSHLMAKASAMALQACPEANAILRWNRIYLRKRIGVFFQVLMTDEGKADLSGATLYDLERKSLLEIVDEFAQKVALVRQKEDPALEKTRGTFQRLPYLFLRPVLRVLSFLSYTLNLDLRRFGIASDPFGSLMITNIGSLGLVHRLRSAGPLLAGTAPLRHRGGEGPGPGPGWPAGGGKGDERERHDGPPSRRRVSRRPDRHRAPRMDGESRGALRPARAGSGPPV